MKRLFLTILLTVLLAAGAVLGAPRVVEAFQEGNFTPSFEPQPVVNLDFSLDTACVVQFMVGGIITGGGAGIARAWVKLDGDSLPPSTQQAYIASFLFGYTPPTPLPEGGHTLTLMASGGEDSDCESAYLQALIFEPDEPSAVVELPVNDTPESRAERVYRVGDLIEVKTLDAAVYDASGRLVERPMGCFAPESSGVYYLTGEERIRKIVVQ